MLNVRLYADSNDDIRVYLFTLCGVLTWMFRWGEVIISHVFCCRMKELSHKKFINTKHVHANIKQIMTSMCFKVYPTNVKMAFSAETLSNINESNNCLNRAFALNLVQWFCHIKFWSLYTLFPRDSQSFGPWNFNTVYFCSIVASHLPCSWLTHAFISSIRRRKWILACW